MKHQHSAHVHSYRRSHLREVRVYERFDAPLHATDRQQQLIRTYEALDWLHKNEWLAFHQPKRPWDYDLNMHGGEMGYTSFYFRDPSKAIQFKLVWAGAAV